MYVSQQLMRCHGDRRDGFQTHDHKMETDVFFLSSLLKVKV